ncbi:MAG: hypothetical protein AAFX41_07570, partial [Bacteroidota bacterium]
ERVDELREQLREDEVQGEWRVASGEWRVASGEWRVASGEWKVPVAARRVKPQAASFPILRFPIVAPPRCLAWLRTTP